MTEATQDYDRKLNIPDDVLALLDGIANAVDAVEEGLDKKGAMNPMLRQVIFEIHTHMLTIQGAIDEGLFDPDDDRKTMRENLTAVRAETDELLDMPLPDSVIAALQAYEHGYKNGHKDGKSNT